MRKVDYLFQRPGSTSWYIRFQEPGGDTVRSLHTSDRRTAEILALPLVAAHRQAVLSRRPSLEKTWQHALEPGREHAGPDGGRIIATDRELIYLGHNGAITKTVPNGAPSFAIANPGPLLARAREFKVFDDAEAGLIEPGPIADQRPVLATKNGDDALFEQFLKQKERGAKTEREARQMWEIFKTVVRKPLRSCTRDDGRALVAYLDDMNGSPIKSTTLERKIVSLVALANFAIGEAKLTLNPFKSVVPKRKTDPADQRRPFKDDDMELIRANLSKLSAHDQLLLRVVAATGMRLGEATSIDHEETEGGLRFCVVGTKTEASRRRVPFPADLLPHLPAKITGPLFAGKSNTISQRLNRFIRDVCGIADRGKVVHSFRHRAQDRLRAAEVPQDQRWGVLGHEEKSISEGYGEGFSVAQLRKAIDQIGGL